MSKIANENVSYLKNGRVELVDLEFYLCLITELECKRLSNIASKLKDSNDLDEDDYEHVIYLVKICNKSMLIVKDLMNNDETFRSEIDFTYLILSINKIFEVINFIIEIFSKYNYFKWNNEYNSYDDKIKKLRAMCYAHTVDNRHNKIYFDACDIKILKINDVCFTYECMDISKNSKSVIVLNKQCISEICNCLYRKLFNVSCILENSLSGYYSEFPCAQEMTEEQYKKVVNIWVLLDLNNSKQFYKIQSNKYIEFKFSNDKLVSEDDELCDITKSDILHIDTIPEISKIIRYSRIFRTLIVYEDSRYMGKLIKGKLIKAKLCEAIIEGQYFDDNYFIIYRHNNDSRNIVFDTVNCKIVEDMNI